MKKIFFLTLIFFCCSGILHSQDQLNTVIQQGHPASVLSSDISNNGKWLATGSKDKTIKLWDIKTGKEMRTFAGHESEVVDVVFSPDDKYIASSSWDHTIRIWDVSTGNEEKTINGHNGLVSSIDYHPEGQFLVSTGVDRKGRIWNLEKEEVILEFTVDPGQFGPDIRYSPDGKFLALGNDDGESLILNSETADTVHRVRELRFSSCGGCYTQVDFSPDMKYFLSAADRGPLVIWKMADGSIESILNEENDDYREAGFSSDGSLVFAADEQQVYIWELSSGKLINTLDGHEKTINTVTSALDKNMVLSGSDDNTAILWNTKNGEKVQTFRGTLSNPPDWGLGLDPDNYWQSYAYSILQLKQQFMLENANNYMLKGMFGNNLLIWDWKSGKKIKELKGHTKSVICFNSSPDNRYIVTGSGDRKVILWDAETGDSIRSFTGHRDVILDVSFSHDGNMIASAGFDGSFRIWKTETGEMIQNVRIVDENNNPDSPYMVVFTPNDMYVVAGTLSGDLKLWEIDSGEEYISFTGHTQVVPAVVFTPDTEQMISISWDKTIKIWDYRTGFLVNKLKGHTGPIQDIKLLADGDKLITGSTDRTAILWDLKSGEILKKFVGHTSAVNSINISRDEDYLLTGSIDGTIKIWNINDAEELITHYFVGENDWMVKNKAGFFHSTEKAREHIHFIRGTDTYEIDQFFEDFYTPDLMERTFQSRRSFDKGLNMIDKLDKSPPPDIEIIFPENKSRVKNKGIDVLVKVTNRGGGIDEIKLLHNGKRLSDNRTGLEKTQKKGGSLYQTYDVELISGHNIFRASAFSKERIESKPSESEVFFEGSGNPADCYILSIGINKYQNPALNLNYARADASNFEELIKGTEGRLFENVYSYTLYDKQATRENILEALSEISEKADPSDVFFFFYAGHGSMVEEDFYFIPTESVRLYEQHSLERSAINAAEIQEQFKNIQALKQLVIVDACQSGGSAEVLAQRGAVNEKAIAQLSRSAGVHVMASAGSEQFATEFKELGHGIFTYVLLEALNGKADGAPLDQKVTIFELKSYLDNIVPELSEKYKGEPQYPYTFSRGHDFPLILY